ncbi:MAG: helix-turn-helix transcriptional regulator [Desulfobacterales bacterium]
MAVQLNQTSIDKRIRIIRGSLEQPEFAKEIGVERNTVSGYENNNIIPSGKALLKLYEKFNANINWLFSGEGESHINSHWATELENKIEKMDSRIKALEKKSLS